MTSQGHVIPIKAEECRQLLGERQIARISWSSSQGIVIIPVNYVLQDDDLLLRVSPDSVLAELAHGREVAVEVEDVDESTANGWSVLVRGRSTVHDGDTVTLPQPWAPGNRDLLIAVRVESLTGRSVSAD
ncbi:MAG: pyridoxamine 5'-phosphate oxidase family protein [Propioniciclava sp.]